MVTLNTNDLAHILEQIKIAEAHSAGTPLDQLVSSPLLPYGLRTVDGAFNNFQPGMERFGAADEPMKRLLDIQLAAAEFAPTRPGQQAPAAPTSYTQTTGNVYDSQPRIISNLVADQTLNNPAAIAAALAVNGVTGAQQLAVVQQIMAAQVQARVAADAVDGAVAARDIAFAAAQGVVDSAVATETAAAANAAAAAAVLAAAQADLAAAEQAVATAAAALEMAAPPSTEVVAQQAAVAAAQAEFDAATC